MRNQKGFTLAEVMLTVGLIAAFVLLTMNFTGLISKNTNLTRNTSTKNRILSTVREIAGLPAALRVSMRASSSGVAVNPDLLACAGGNPPNSCKTGIKYPLTLYSPVILRTATGGILGVQPITSPENSANPMRLDTFGAPCTTAGPDCPLLVTTSFKAQCGPAPLPATPLSPLNLEFVPLTDCTVADVVEVTYNVQLDPSLESTHPELAAFISKASGSVVVQVRDISGNVPQ
jgi:prepilin-type N-terminal cleavage/methylation domain-containing protein